MHNNFLDKRRRHLRLQPDQVDLALPEHFAASYPKFINLLSFYYEFQGEQKATELLHHLFASRDITETDITLLSYIEDELLLGDAYFESFATGDAEKRAAANFSNTLFRSKGTKFAIEWFFRSFYGIDAEIIETNQRIFELGKPESSIGPDSVHFLTDDKLYQTFAYLVRSSIPITEWEELFKLFVHPAGMYLGGELLIEDVVQARLASEAFDSSVSSRLSPTYTLVTQPFSTDSEGTRFDFSLQATNLPNNQGQYKYFINNLTTSEDDFAFGADSTFPDSANKQTFLLSPNMSETAAVGIVTIPTLHDSDETEGTESFQVFFEDEEGREVINQTIILNDIVSVFSISDDTVGNEIDEGDTVTFTVTAEAGTVPNNGSTTLEYQVFPISADSVDFASTAFPSTGTRIPFNIRDDSGSFTVSTVVDGTSGGGDDNETFNVKIYTLSGIEKATSDTITINDLNPQDEYSLTPATVTITEGDDIEVTLATPESMIGRDVTYTITGTDSRVPNKAGTLTVTSASETFTLSTTSSSDVYQGATSETITLTSSTSGFFSPELTDTVALTINDADETFDDIVVDLAGQTEGDTITFTITGTNLQDGNRAKYYIDHGDTTNADFSVAPPTTVGTAAAISFTSNSGTVSLTFAENGDENNEDFEIVILDNDDVEVLRTSYTIIGVPGPGDPPAPEYTLTPRSTSVNENGSVTVDFEVVNDDDGSYYYYVSGSGITSDDFSSGYAPSSSRQEITVTSGISTIDFTLAEDQDREGTETFRVFVSKTSTSGVIAQSSEISITDTSTQAYTVSLSDVTEGSTLNCAVIGNLANASAETIYVTFSGAGVTDRITTLQPAAQSVGANQSIIFSSTTTVDAAVNGDQTITATARIGSYSGTIVGTDTSTMSDAAASFTLTNNGPKDEGQTVTFTFGGTNVPTGTYYYWLNDIQPVQQNPLSSTAAGSAIISVVNSTGVNVGDEVRGDIGFPAGTTVVSKTSQTITMSDNNTESSARTTGDYYFATPTVWEDFTVSTNPPYGEFSHTTNTSTTFDVDIADTDDLEDGLEVDYTMTVNSSNIGPAVKTNVFTINDPDVDDTPNVQRGSLTDPDSYTCIGSGNDLDTTTNLPTCSLILLNTGAIEVTLDNDDQGDQTLAKGNWIDDTDPANFTASDYECIATFVEGSNNNSQYPGDFGVAENLGSSRAWQVKPPNPADDQIEIAFVGFDLLIRHVDTVNRPSNAITTRINLTANATDFSTGSLPGGGDPIGPGGDPGQDPNLNPEISNNPS